ncbi:MAG: RNA polymerase sporulation sigma factor SigK [Candidatus Limivicinus sp.]
MNGGEIMVETAFILLMNSILLMLRIAPGDSFPKPLSRAEEQEYLARWAQGDVEARNLLVEHNLRLVAHIMKKYYTQTDDVDDLISIGTIGLIKGVNTYKPDKGVRLATYASRCIENEILMHFRSRKKSAGDVSLSDALDVDGDGSGLSIMDVVAQEDDMAERIGNAELCQELLRSIETSLTKREAKIIRLRYGLDGASPMTQKETAQLCGISRSYVSRIEKKALEKLRLSLGESGCF